MFSTLHAAGRKLLRDREMPFSVLVQKGMSYAQQVALAPLYLHAVDKVGSGVRTDGRPRIENYGYMELGARTQLRSVLLPVELTTAPGARLVIGADCLVNYGTSLGAHKEITIGHRCLIGPYSMIIDTQFHDAYERAKRPEPAPVIIEDDVWIGARCSIMPGVHLGRGCIVGTAAVVNRDVEPFTIVAGIPAREVGRLDPARFHVPSKDFT